MIHYCPQPFLIFKDLKHGWLFPYLTQTENLMWGRWQYWQECQLLPEVAWERWKWEQAMPSAMLRKSRQYSLKVAWGGAGDLGGECVSPMDIGLAFI